MAQTGRPGGRQSLENTRVKGQIHSSVPSVESAPQADLNRNASVQSGKSNTNRSSTPDRVPTQDKAVSTSGKVGYPSKGPTTNRKKRGAL